MYVYVVITHYLSITLSIYSARSSREVSGRPRKTPGKPSESQTLRVKKACRDRLPEFARGLPRLPGESIPGLEDSEDPWQGGLPRVFRWQRGGLPRKTPGKPSLLLTSVY